MPYIKALVIDPYACTIEPVQIEDHFTAWYAPLSTAKGKVDMAEKIQTPPGYWPPFLAHGDMILVDEAGLYKDHTRWFGWHGAYQTFAGKGLIVGTIGENQADVQTSIESARKHIVFFEGSELQFETRR
jgi:hypothetical protein